MDPTRRHSDKSVVAEFWRLLELWIASYVQFWLSIAAFPSADIFIAGTNLTFNGSCTHRIEILRLILQTERLLVKLRQTACEMHTYSSENAFTDLGASC